MTLTKIDEETLRDQLYCLVRGIGFLKTYRDIPIRTSATCTHMDIDVAIDDVQEQIDIIQERLATQEFK